MQQQVIILATPIFFVLIVVKWALGSWRRHNTYRLHDMLASLSLGALSQVGAVFLQPFRIGIYTLLEPHVALFALPADSPWVWLGGLLLYDLCYYWQHRMSHHVNLLWASHAVHHQSEDYNLSTALRQPATDALFVWIFYLPMAMVGVPPALFAALALVDLLYQFWVHTQQIGRLGWFDRVFVSPSNHRAHHGVNDIYLDRNFGGILILWDRLFGTFVEEQPDHPVVFGTRTALRSWNPVRANLSVYLGAWRDAARTDQLADKFHVWFGPPGWQPPGVPSAGDGGSFDLGRPRYEPWLPLSIRLYCVVQFIILLLATTQFLATYPAMAALQELGGALLLAAGFWIVGGLLDGDRVFALLELVRLPLTAAAALAFGLSPDVPASPAQQIFIVLSAALSALAAVFIFRSTRTIHGHSSVR